MKLSVSIVALILAAMIRVTLAASPPSNAVEIINRFPDFAKSHSLPGYNLVYIESYQTADGAQQRWRFEVVNPSKPDEPPMMLTCRADSSWDQFVTEAYGQVEAYIYGVQAIFKGFQKAFQSME